MLEDKQILAPHEMSTFNSIQFESFSPLDFSLNLLSHTFNSNLRNFKQSIENQGNKSFARRDAFLVY